LHLNDVPVLNEDEAELYQIRRATEDDIPTLMRLYQRYTSDKLVSSRPDEAYWRYDLSTRSFAVHHYCLLDNQGRLIGAYAAAARAWKSTIHLWSLVVDEAVSLRSVLPSVMRSLKKHGENSLFAETKADQKLTTIRFSLGGEHPAYEALDAKLGPLQPPYSWYIRVPDLPGFIRHIAPALEKRLAASVMSGFSGELKLSFYRGGVRLAFEQGKLTKAEDWCEPDSKKDWDGAGFPPLVFLQLLFGHRSLDELRYAFPDCWADEEPALLLKALFPKQPSWVIPLG
jgi:N-acetylglutamate synthase-like GNAT family acetyltransferase